jgi:RNA polymerase sigma-70 factor (ECF subfamily)
MTADHASTLFSSHRPRLLRIAYRMLGSLAEAEDVVQDAWLRWHAADRMVVQVPEAFLVRTVTRLCLDVLKSARVQREQYPGVWLPEPLVGDGFADGEDLTLTLMVALERLSPLERAAFLLHDVFELSFDEVADALERDAAACRQLATRARRNVQLARPRYPVSEQRGREIATAFLEASVTGDVVALKSLLAADVIHYSDGGGKRTATLKPIYGHDKVARLLAGLAAKRAPLGAPPPRVCTVGGMPGLVGVGADGNLDATALAIDDGKIVAVYLVRNPDKLTRLDAALGS